MFSKKVYITLYITIILSFSISCKNNITDGNENTNDLGNYAGVYKSATYDINIGSDGSITVAESGAQSITGTVSSKEGNKYTIKLDNGTQIIIEFLDNGSVTITKPDGTTESATKTDNGNGENNGEHIPQMITVYCGSNSIDIDINSDYSKKIKDLWLSVFANKKVYILKTMTSGNSAIIRPDGDYQHNFDGLVFKYIASSIYTFSFNGGELTNYVVGVYSNVNNSTKNTLPHCIFFVEGDDNKVHGMYVSNTITLAEAISNQDKTKTNWWVNETGFRYRGFLKDN